MYKSIWLIQAIGIRMLNLNISPWAYIWGGLIIGGIFASKMWGAYYVCLFVCFFCFFFGGGAYLQNVTVYTFIYEQLTYFLTIS